MQRLVLVGGGHAHLEVLRAIARRRIPGTEVTLVSPGRYAAYTGMVPGYLAGDYDANEIRFDLRALALAAGGRFVEAAAVAVDGSTRQVHLASEVLAFDACSVDVGSAPAGLDVPGIRNHAIALRPLGNAQTLLGRLDSLLAQRAAFTSCVVIGGGAAGLEVAHAIARRNDGPLGVTLVHEGDELLSVYPARARRLAMASCERLGIAVLLGARVTHVCERHVELDSGRRVASHVTVSVTGAAPPALLAASRLPLSPDGYFEVDATLRASNGAPVWGAGDCVALRGEPWVPKAGVHAVREGPVLAHNLRAYILGNRPREYRPQTAFLSLLSTARGRAILSWRGVAVEHGLAQTLKRSIDRRFMRRYCA